MILTGSSNSGPLPTPQPCVGDAKQGPLPFLPIPGEHQSQNHVSAVGEVAPAGSLLSSAQGQDAHRLGF